MIRVLVSAFLLVAFNPSTTWAANVSEIINFIGTDGTSAVEYSTRRTDYTNFSLYISNQETPDTYDYIYPFAFNFNTDSFENVNAIEFGQGDFATLRQSDLSGFISKDDAGSFVYEINENADTNLNEHYGIWMDGGFDTFVFVWVLPANFEFVDYKSNRDGNWKLTRNTLAYYGDNVNDVTFRIAYRPKTEAAFSGIANELANTDGVEITREGADLRLALADRVLFPSGSATLSDQGQALLTRVAQSLKAQEGVSIVVAGHTDNVPIQGQLTQTFATNWELSAARSLAVVHHMLDQGVTGENLEARAFGETRPATTNETQEGRAANRRIEILVQSDE